MPTSIPLQGSGISIATSDDAGTADDPMVLQFSADAPAASFPVFGSGVFLAAASGSGTPDDPYLPAVNVAGAVALPIDLDVFQVDTDGNLNCQAITGASISLGGSAFSYDGDVTFRFIGTTVIFSTLPTSDPHNLGQLWNNGGVVNISAG